jgi:hypothetical protein
LAPGQNSAVSPEIPDEQEFPQINASTPYLDNGKHFRQGILGRGHRRQKAEEVVSRRIRKHLEIVGRILWAQTRVNGCSPSLVLYSRGLT